MIQIETILCPTDLSPESDEALRYAVALAANYKARLVLLNCTERRTSTEKDSEQKSAAIALQFEHALIQHLGLELLTDLDWQVSAIDNVDRISDSIIDQAKKHRADLIVMRSRRRPRAAMILGSTAEAVCAKAPCSVLVTHPDEREWVSYSTGQIDLQRILVANDFSPESTQALGYGVSLAQEYQAELHQLHVLQNKSLQEPELAWTVAGHDNYYTQTARKLQESIPKELFLWSNVTNALCYGSVYEAVLAYAKKNEIDLICLGVTGTDWTIGKLFGSNGQRILREAPCPVLVARPLQSIREEDGKTQSSSSK